MTYKNNFVVDVRCKGKILRIKDDFVYLPFGSEYSIYLKNLSSKRASVKIHIDGQDVLDYSSLILNANTSTELEGFLKGTNATNKFKFIKKTKEIQEHRGDKIDDGIIRVEFAYEIPKPIIKKTIINEDHHHYHHNPFHWDYHNTLYASSNIKTDRGDIARGITSSSPFNQSSMTVSSSLGTESLGTPLNDEGITVKGSEINQQFRYGSIGELEPAEVVIIRMKGIDNKPNAGFQPSPLTIQSKLTCSSCGKSYKSSFKYCSNCGTYLE